MSNLRLINADTKSKEVDLDKIRELLGDSTYALVVVGDNSEMIYAWHSGDDVFLLLGALQSLKLTVWSEDVEER